jgi:hypothetical protein
MGRVYVQYLQDVRTPSLERVIESENGWTAGPNSKGLHGQRAGWTRVEPGIQRAEALQIHEETRWVSGAWAIGGSTSRTGQVDSTGVVFPGHVSHSIWKTRSVGVTDRGAVPQAR